MKSLFEHLPTEIFFEIFDYLNIYDIFHCFINLNKRLNEILRFYRLKINFQNVTLTEFHYICQYIHPEQIYSIYFSDELMPNQVELFEQYFSHIHHRFIHLKKLYFINTSTILTDLSNPLALLSIKTYLKTNQIEQSIHQLLQQQSKSLTYFHIDGSYAFRSIDTPFPLLTHLIIDYCTISQFHRIMDSIRSPLIYLKLFFDQEEQMPILNFEQISNTLQYLSLTFSQEIVISFDFIKQCLEQSGNLIDFTIQATTGLDLMNGQLWEEYLYDKNLKNFNFKFTLANNIICTQDKISLLQSFRSPFWIEQHRWYVACEKGEFHSSRPMIYSIPYFQSSLIFYPLNQFSPLSTNDNQLLLSNYNINLILTYHQNLLLPNTPFDHVYSLTLLTDDLPSIDILQTIVNLKHIHELDISLVKNYSIDEFQNLIDHTMNLKTIQMQYNPYYYPPLHIYSYVFIRRDKEISIIDSNNIQRFCYLFFHIRYLEITIQSKHIMIQLINQLHYLERIKIFCYQDFLRDLKYSWFLQNIPRLKTIHFTYRITSSYLLLCMGDTKKINNTITKEKSKCSSAKHHWYNGCLPCKIQ